MPHGDASGKCCNGRKGPSIAVGRREGYFPRSRVATRSSSWLRGDLWSLRGYSRVGSFVEVVMLVEMVLRWWRRGELAWELDTGANSPGRSTGALQVWFSQQRFQWARH